MKVFDDKHIKNIGLVGAHKAGKTSLAETMVFEAGLTNRRGTVEAHNTVSDYHEIEHQKEMSIYATPLHTEWRNYKINIIDTPGSDDFIGEIATTMKVADTVVMVVDSHYGVEVGTEILWNYVDEYRKPTLFVLNKIDHDDADFEASYASIKSHFGNNAIAVQYPYTHEGKTSIIDLLKMTMYVFPDDGGKPEKLPIPDSEKEKAEQLHNELVEKAAENDEELMELYFDKGELDEDEMRQGIKLGMMHHELFPVFCTSAINNVGTGRLMGFIDNVCPTAHEWLEEHHEDDEKISANPEDDTVVFVFRTMFEANLGQISFFKVMSGELKAGDHLINAETDQEEVFGHLYIMDGHDRHEVDKLSSGDIGATLKLKNTSTNQTLHEKGKKAKIRPIRFPEPRMRKAVFANNKRDDEKLGEVLKKIQAQDPTAKFEYSRELRQLILGCQGELHLSAIEWTLKNEYGLDIRFEQPRIAYRETIQRPASASYRHKKQSGGAGQFGEVHLKIEPFFEGMEEPTGFSLRGKDEVELEWGGKLVFYNCIVGGVIDQRYMPSIVKGIMQVMEEGPLTGSYVRDIRVMVYDGKMHPVDSNDISFQIAGGHAFKEAFLNAQPKLMEPVQELEVKVPEDVMGDVMTDLQSRRSIILGMDSQGSWQKIKARTPLAELYRYSTSLRSLTQGKGSFKSNFAEFAPVPNNVQEDLIKSAKENKN
jgi:elongation factor G